LHLLSHALHSIHGPELAGQELVGLLALALVPDALGLAAEPGGAVVLAELGGAGFWLIINKGGGDLGWVFEKLSGKIIIK
jgi:hypothetical protein